MPISIPSKRLSPEFTETSSVFTTKTAATFVSSPLATTFVSSPLAESPKNYTSPRESRPSSPLTFENMSIHSNTNSFDSNRDNLSFIMEKYRNASPRSSETGDDSRPSSPDRRRRRHPKKASDLVLTPPRALPFPYHNDSLFLPVAECEPKSPVLSIKSQRPKASSLPSPKVRSTSPSPSLRTHTHILSSSSPPSLGGRASEPTVRPASPKLRPPTPSTAPLTRASTAPVLKSDNTVPPSKPLLYRPSSKRMPFPFVFTGEKTRHHSPRESILAKLWRFLTGASFRKQQRVSVSMSNSPIQEKTPWSNSPTPSIVFVT
ncbi:hypothetical protein BC938DRAFT_473808 [Jimgerdemannia flammicorona]|uniref:Uncharacterized protein n=1 Tax=Jimgerdemannia flammicorona TaxID=994334 RepID=A0A433Q3A6_9FUNG|nr:hypothetical protein BC938DRAFT_473808 [Jimgerdemannia flammicorona]